MRSNENSRSCRRVLFRSALVVCGIGLYLGSIYGVWRACAHTARHKTETTLDYACGDLANTWGYHFRGALSLDGFAAMGVLRNPVPRSAAEMREILAASGLSELHLVGRDGRIVASIDSKCVGIDLFRRAGFEGLSSLTNALSANVDLPLHSSLVDPNVRVLYTGLPFRDGASVLCGLSEEDMARYCAFIGDDMMSTWQFGETGCYIVADDRTHRLVHDAFGFGGKEKTLEEIGAGNVIGLPDDSQTTHVGTFFGEKCYFRHFHYIGYRVLATIPAGEFYDSARNTTIAAALIVLFVLIVLGIAVRRIINLYSAAKLREAIDAQRQKDFGMARSIQLHSQPSVFPPYPSHVDHFDIFAVTQVSRVVGGDFYDFFFAGRDRLVLIIGDVSGIGVPAAMFMMRAKAAIQAAIKGGDSLVEAICQANRSLCKGNADIMFLSTWVGVYDLRTGEVEYVNAGHISPVVRHADGSLERLASRFGLVLGIKGDYAYTARKIRLMPGDELCLYTDGLTKAFNAAGEQYCDARLERSIRAVGPLSDARAVCDQIRNDYNAYVDDVNQKDDMTILVFRVRAYVV